MNVQIKPESVFTMSRNMQGRLNFKSIKPVIKILAQEFIEWQKLQQDKKLNKSGSGFQILTKREVTV